MTWATKNFSIGGVTIEVPQALSFNQTYDEFGGVATHRMLGGNAFRQTNWTKLRTTLSGEGMVPSGLKSIDWTQPQVINCGTTRELSQTSNVFSLPTGTYRTDTGYAPFGFAIVDGYPVKTPATGLTLTVVPGAAYYVLCYYPVITAFVEPPQVDFDRTAGKWRWAISAEEA